MRQPRGNMPFVISMSISRGNPGTYPSQDVQDAAACLPLAQSLTPSPLDTIPFHFDNYCTEKGLGLPV